MPRVNDLFTAMPAGRSLAAFIDESQSDATRDPGAYLLAAALCDLDRVDVCRESLTGLLLRGQQKVHWRDEGDGRRRTIAAAVASLPLHHLVVVRAGHANDRPERRRRHCLTRLLWELDQRRVGVAVFESRGPVDDRRDRDILDAQRASHAIATALRIEHEIGMAEPLLWVPDAVCGTVIQDRTGGSREYLDTLQDAVQVDIITV